MKYALILDYLKEEGYLPKVVDDEIHFKMEGNHVCIDCQDDDSYIRLLIPNIWEIEDRDEYLQALYAVDKINREVKVAKACFRADKQNVYISVEGFYKKPDDLFGIFPRIKRALLIALRDFCNAMHDEVEPWIRIEDDDIIDGAESVENPVTLH